MASKNATFDLEASEAILIPFKRIVISFLMFCGFLLFAWITSWVFVFKFYPADGLDRLQNTIQVEMATISKVQTHNLPIREVAVVTANALYEGVYGASGINEMGDRFQRGDYQTESDIRAAHLYAQYYPWLKASMLSTQIMGLRLAMLICTLPAVLLLYAVALADGLTERAIRRDCGGRESASIYHRSKYFQLLLLCVFTLLFLAWPTPTLYPAAPLIGGGALAALARVQWKYYKKYL